MSSANDDINPDAPGARRELDAAADLDPPGADIAFEAVYREHSGTVLRLLQRRVGNEADAVELAQESWAQLLRYRHQPPDSLKALLFRIVVNMAGTHARRSRTHHRLNHVPIDDVPLSSADTPHDEALARDEERRLLVAAIRDMPCRCRQAFVLSRFHGLPRKEIAQRMGISLAMVERHITKGLAFIRTRVGDLQQSCIEKER